ncbi:unnamed protein product (macronuclear) [Paramecium tetraurelia]|uniref:Uncharacterized protein n=1 Tax=Paramecium tetraurelia TaxID=5888 RepID=A0E2B3_PARTE|nr:uncharacterized protein GSPATT00022602001 [Paramecium tetraurelia]CAK89430.1 unnamed protein product [Paramecium tetraurelia]|eukprot:XP_001456827.1 hypothetical protein (macronuclear) [Paramecium tetraurelia strain d4-2]
MIRQQSIISGEYLVFDTHDLIKKGQYRQCLQKINRLVFDPQLAKGQPQFLQLQIQLCRRLLHCCNKILKKYFQKFSEKSHKVQSLLNRTIELSLFYIDFLEIYAKESIQKDASPTASPSPTMKKKQLFKELYAEQISLAHKMEMFFSQDIVSNYVPKSNIWFHSQCQNCYFLLMETLFNTYRFHKYNRTPYAALTLNLITQVVENVTITNNRQSLFRGELQTLIGNAYFELYEYNKADQYYIQSIEQTMEAVRIILGEIEKMKSNIDLNAVKIQLAKLISQILVNFELQSLVNQQMENYDRCLEIVQLAVYFNKILEHFKICKEVTSQFETRSTEIKENYKDHVDEINEISRLLSHVFQISLKEHLKNSKSSIDLQQLSQVEQYEQKIFEKYQYSQNNQTFFIKNREVQKQLMLDNVLQQQQQSQYFVKNQSMKIFKLKHNSSQHSIEQPSTNYNDSQLQLSNNKNDQSHLTQIDTSHNSSIKTQLNKTLKVNSNHRQSFLSELIHLRNQGSKSDEKEKQVETEIEKNFRQQKELLFKISNKNAYQPLDQVVKSYINQNLVSYQKCQSLDEVKQNAKQICQAEAEVHKEVPITKSLLQARKMTCPQGVMVKDKQAENEFNKLLEFNVIEYFDFVQTNKDLAVTNLKAQQENKQVRIAQQNLFSDNFIPKKKLNFIDQEEIKQIQQAQQIAEQAENLLKRTYDKRKSTQKQSRIALLNFMQDKVHKSQKQDTIIPMSYDQSLDQARNSIKKVLSLNEKQKHKFEEEDQELRETELPYKFKRSLSGSSKKKIQSKSILIKKEFGHLCSSTKNIREKDFGSSHNTETKIRGISLDRIK